MKIGNRISVIVAQDGADLSDCVPHYQLDSAVEVFQQRPQETATLLSQRIRSRLGELVRGGVIIEDARLVAKRTLDVQDVMSAATLLRGLVAAMVAVGAGHVYLHAAPRDAHAGFALTALADAIGDQLRGTGVEFFAVDPCAPPAVDKPRATL